MIAVSLSKLESQNESQHPPVKRLVTPRVNPQSMHRVQYSKPSKTSTPDSSKICNRVDTKYQVSTFLSPYVPVFFNFFYFFFYNLGMFLKPIIMLSLQKVLIVCLRRALRQWEPLWNRLSFYGFNSGFWNAQCLVVVFTISWCAIESSCAQWKNIKRQKCFPFVFSWTQSCHWWNMLMFCVNYFRWAMCSKWELTMHWVIVFDCFGVDGVW